MFSIRHVVPAIATTAVLASGAASQPAFAGGVDLRSPDAVDAARVAQPITPLADLRSPDSADNHRFAAAPVDRRSPDAIDATARRTIQPAPTVELVRAGSGHDGFDWGDAGIGAGALAALVLVALGAAMMTSQRRHPTMG